MLLSVCRTTGKTELQERQQTAGLQVSDVLLRNACASGLALAAGTNVEHLSWDQLGRCALTGLTVHVVLASDMLYASMLTLVCLWCVLPWLNCPGLGHKEKQCPAEALAVVMHSLARADVFLLAHQTLRVVLGVLLALHAA